MSEQSARERLDTAKIDTAFYDGWRLDVGLEEFEGGYVISFAAALTYGAGMHREGALIAARAMCGNCADDKGCKPATRPFNDGRWRHEALYVNGWKACDAGPIYDKLKAMEVENEEAKVTASSD